MAVPATTKHSRYYTYIQPVVQSKTVKSVAPYIFSLVTIAVFVVFAIRPTVSTILSLQKQIENNQQILNSLNQKTKDLTQARSNYNGLPPDIKSKINNLVPTQPNVTSLVANLQTSLATQASVSAIQIQPLTVIDTSYTPKKKAILGEVDFTYNVQGSYSQLLQTLNNILKSSRAVGIKSLVLSKQEVGTIMSITGKVYYTK